MFSTFLEKLSGFFDKHWLLRYFFPSLVFWAAGLAVYGAARGIDQPLDLWHRQPTEVQVILLAGALIWVTLFAYLLANFGTSLIRLFEGYWDRLPLRWLREKRRTYYERRYEYLERQIKQTETKAKPYELQRLERELWLCFPRGDVRMPTRLGNIIRAAEVYPLHRYGADPVILWPRLQQYLPAEFTEAFNSAQTAMEVMLVLSALSFLFSTITCTLLAVLTLNVWLFLGCAAGFVLAWICYRNSLQGALGYAELIKTAFDLYRDKLLEGFGLKRPSSSEEEWRLWEGLSQKVYRNIPLPEAPAPKAEPPPQTWLGKVITDLLAVIRAAFPEPAPPAGPAPAAAQARQPSAPPALPEPRDTFPRYYFGIFLPLCVIVAGVMLCRAQQPVRRVALAWDVPAYRLLGGNDLKMEKQARSETPDDGIPELFDVLDKAYLTKPLTAGSILTKSEIRAVENPSLLSGRVAMGIAVPSATALGGALRLGDAVSLAIAPAKDALAADPMCDLKTFQRLLVLDVKPPEKESSSYVVVLAVPPGCQASLAGAAGRISLARTL
jgi:hypothetical protein